MDKNRHLLWKETGCTLVKDFRIFKACDIKSIAPDGRERVFVKLDSPDWVNVVCVIKNDDDGDCFLMVRQFRHGSGSVTIEFPAGLVDPDEDPSDAAKRELLEETGYKAEKLIMIGEANPDPAFMNNTVYTYFAQNPVKTDIQSLDPDELIDIQIVPVKIFEDQMGGGELINAITILAYIWYKKFINEL
jgi:8-oxo-dGTP pyrophosphatase MutT (NUDIX family)